MDQEQITATVTAAAQAIEERYVFPDRGVAVAAALRDHLDHGRYAACSSPQRLAELVTADLHAAGNHLHLRLRFHEEVALGAQDEAERAAAWAEQARRTAGGMRRVERLDDNVALVEIGPVIGHPTQAGDAM